MYLCRKLTKRSTTEIGSQFGGKDHTTILHGSQKIENELKENPEMARVLKDIENLL
jgi:chromosomal replication initiator protein